MLAVLSGCSVSSAPKADWVVLNARVMTVDAARPEASAFAVRGGRFVAVGSESDVRPFIGPDTYVTRLGGAMVVPGLIDAHLHFLGEGTRLQRLDLTGTGSKAEVLARLADAVKTTPADAWVRGRGWDQNDWPDTAFPTASDLDPLTPTNPVMLTRIDGHAAWLNSLALETAGINAATVDPHGGRLLRLSGGRPSGILVDNAMDLVTAKLPQPGRDETRLAAQLAAAECFAAGLTSVHEPGCRSSKSTCSTRCSPRAHACPDFT